MKRKLMAVVISMCMAFSAMGTVYADDLSASDSSEQEQTTEAETEKETEAETEKVTEKATEAATEKATEATTKKSEVKTEATTSSTTTTTKKTSTSSDKNDKNVKESKSVTVNVDSTKDLGDYLSDTAPDAASFDWSTSDDSIARVTSMGKLTGEKKGTCTVTATAEKSGTKYTYTFNITVKSSSSSDKKSISIDVDEEKDLYRYVDDDYSASKYDWESSDTKYVKVSTRGVVTGVKEGSATVTATYESGSTSLEYKFKVTVGSDDSSSSKSSKVSEKTSWDIYVGRGDDVDISLILEDDPDEYDWSVDDEDIAEIDEDDGIITGVDEGETDIEAEGDTDYKFTVYVGRDYSTEEITIKGEDTYDLDDILDVDDYSFKSDRKAVATVNSKGVVTGVANGVATIICENEDDEDEIIQVFVTVKNISTT
ncbi:MAG: Ig-like domain-containing protein, partial [Clostridia bacterium]|nr:Ig-like domain-containing protein [Clostridia bacterium]